MTTTSEATRHAARASLRHATFIDPRTGGRVKSLINLHDLDGSNEVNQYDDDNNPDSPLLPPNRSPRSVEEEGTIRKYWRKTTDGLIIAAQFVVSDTGKGVFKCAVAYTLGSLSTFVPVLSAFFGRNDSKHLIATITVYFHPARSLGSMLDALLLVSAAFIYVTFFSVLSMSVAAFFADIVHVIVIGQAVVLFLFVGGGLGLIAWIKLKRGDALVNVACSLASLALITVLTKEGAVQAGDYSFEKIAQILKMIVMGVISTMLVSFLIFPISARRLLRENIGDLTDTLADMLALITSSFLSGEESELEDQTFASVSDRHDKLSVQLEKNLKESKYEHYFSGDEKQAFIEARLARCLQRITQSMGGLRSAAAMQFVVIRPTPGVRQGSTLQAMKDMIAASPTDTVPQRAIGARPEASRVFSSGSFGNWTAEPQNADSRKSTLQPEQQWHTPTQIFELFIEHLGPSMRSLAYTMKEILDDMPYDIDSKEAATINPRFRTSLSRALDLYKEARSKALETVYEKMNIDPRRPIEVAADWEEAAACCGHFSFSLLEVAEQIKQYLVIIDELQLQIEEAPNGKSYTWLKFWQSKETRNRTRGFEDDINDTGTQSQDLSLKFRIPEAKQQKREEPATKGKRAVIKQKFFRNVYSALSFFRREDIKFAIKVSFGAMLYALPSFIPATRPYYAHWRGEWGLLSYILVCSITIGASNTTGYSRILGTCLGAALAIVGWEISHENPVILGVYGFCMAYWTAYIIVGKGKGPMGRFIMLTYNLSALYAYSLSVLDDDNDGDEEDNSNRPKIFSIAGHRVAAVISGCIWGLIITRAVWPISARSKIKAGLSLTWLRMGLIWKRDPLSIITEGPHPIQYMNLHEELELQRYINKLQALAVASKSEFDLRGPFPYDIYNRILKSSSRMLDAFHSMNAVILKDLQTTEGETALLKATELERAQLCSRISHLFSVLASSMKLEYPITNDALPDIEHTRDRLLARIFGYRRADAESHQTSDEDFGLLYTYALVTGQLNLEIQAILKEVEALFGVLDEDALRLD